MDTLITEQRCFHFSIRKCHNLTSQFGILQVVSNHSGFRVIINSITRSLIQFLAVGRKLFVALGAVKCGVTNFQVSFMILVVNRKDINQAVRHGWLIRCHLLFLLSPLKEKSSSDWNANPL